MLLFVLVGLLICFTILVIGYKMDNPKPKFKVGDLLRSNGLFKESWEKKQSPIIRIEEIGIKQYRTSMYVRSIKEWTEDPVKVMIADQNDYEKIESVE